MNKRRNRRPKDEPNADHAFAHLGRHLLAARNACGLSQQDLAARCGLDQAHISRFEKGERQPTLRQLARLATALTVPFQWFINGSERPGNNWREIAVELHRLGIRDLALSGAIIPGALRPTEEVLALAISGDRPSPRVVEALPAVLAWNVWDPSVLAAYGDRDDEKVLRRLGWLADIVLTIHRNEGFPGGTQNDGLIGAFQSEIEFRHAASEPAEPDGLGFPEQDKPLPPVSRRWNVTYAADLDVFRRRAEHLLSLDTPSVRTHTEDRP